LKKWGRVLKRNGGGHDWYTNKETEQSQPVPRHNEIDEFLAKAIIKKLSK
jgi:mRNA interferase HicA